MVLPEAIVLYTVIVLSLAGLAVGAFFVLKASPLSEEEKEKRRRAHLSRVGRVVEARILDILDSHGEHGGEFALLSYRYSVRGVDYEAVQDVRFHQEKLDLSQIAAGQSASVKYDPQNVVNSIVLAEDWSGI